jgi:hypothetical protein
VVKPIKTAYMVGICHVPWQVLRDGSGFTTLDPIIEGSLEVKLPTIWTNKKQR